MKLLEIALLVLACVACGAAAPARQAQSEPKLGPGAASEIENEQPSLQVEEVTNANLEEEVTDSPAGLEEDEEILVPVDEKVRDALDDVVEAPNASDVGGVVEESESENSEPKSHHRVRRFGGLPRNGGSKKFSPSSRMKHKLGGGGKSRT